MHKLISDEKLYNEPHLLVSPTLAAELGIRNAILLQYIHQLLNPARNKDFKDNRYWVHTYPSMLSRQLKCMSHTQIQRYMKLLEAQKILMPDPSRMGCYTINYAKLMELRAYQEPEFAVEHNEAATSFAQRLGAAIKKLAQSLIRRGKNL